MNAPASTPQTSKLTSIVSALVSLAALGAGRFLGWAFGLQFALPLFAALVTIAVARRRFPPEAQAFVGGGAAHAAIVTWNLLSFALLSLQHGFHMGPMGFLLWSVSLGGLVWLLARPGPLPAGLLVLDNGYVLVRSVWSLPAHVRFAQSEGVRVDQILNTGVPLVLSIIAITLLVRGLLATRTSAATPAS